MKLKEITSFMFGIIGVVASIFFIDNMLHRPIQMQISSMEVQISDIEKKIDKTTEQNKKFQDTIIEQNKKFQDTAIKRNQRFENKMMTYNIKSRTAIIQAINKLNDKGN